MGLTADWIDTMLESGIPAEQVLAAVRGMLVREQEREAAEPTGPITITRHIRAQVIARDGLTCRYCSRQVDEPCLDHVIPRSKGGRSGADNLVVSCRSCNASKKDRDLADWRRA